MDAALASDSERGAPISDPAGHARPEGHRTRRAHDSDSDYEQNLTSESDADVVAPSRRSGRHGSLEQPLTRATRADAEAAAQAPASSAAEDAERDAEYDPSTCWICRDGRTRVGGTRMGAIVYCDGCQRGYHQKCYGRPLVYAVPPGMWFCKRCSHRRGADAIIQAQKFAWDGAWQAALESEHMRDVDVQRVLPAEDPMPFFNPYEEASHSEELMSWASRQLRRDSNFLVLWDWWRHFGPTVGVKDVSFEALEAALCTPSTSGLLSRMHVAVLHAYGKSHADEWNWPHHLALLLEDFDTPFRAVLRLATKSSSAFDLHSVAAAVTKRVDAMSVTSNEPCSDMEDGADGDDGAESTQSSEDALDYFRLHLGVRVQLLCVLCEELLTFQGRSNSKLLDFIAGEAFADGAEAARDVDPLHMKTTPVFTVPLFDRRTFTDAAVKTIEDTPFLRALKQRLGASVRGEMDAAWLFVSDAVQSPGRLLSRSSSMGMDTDKVLIAVSTSVAEYDVTRASTSDAMVLADGEEQTLAASPPPLDDRSIQYYFFQDCDGQVRLARARHNLPYDSIPKNITIRTLIMNRCVQRARPETLGSLIKQPHPDTARHGVGKHRRSPSRDAGGVLIDITLSETEQASPLRRPRSAADKPDCNAKVDMASELTVAEGKGSKPAPSTSKLPGVSSEKKQGTLLSFVDARRSLSVVASGSAGPPLRPSGLGALAGLSVPKKKEAAAVSGRSITSFFTPAQRSAANPSGDDVALVDPARPAKTPSKQEELAVADSCVLEEPHTQGGFAEPAESRPSTQLERGPGDAVAEATHKSKTAKPASRANGKRETAPFAMSPTSPGVSFVRVLPCSPMKSEFETVAASYEELQEFVDVMSVSPLEQDRALAKVLRERIMKQALLFRKVSRISMQGP